MKRAFGLDVAARACALAGVMALGPVQGSAEGTNTAGHYEVRLRESTNVFKARFRDLNSGPGHHETWFQNVTLPFVIRTAFTNDQSGRVLLKVDGEDGRAPQLYSTRGLSEAAFAVHLLVTNQLKEAWLKRLVPATNHAMPIRQFDPAKERLDYASTETVSAEEKRQVVELAKRIYDERRPELCLNFPTGLLFYPASQDPEVRWMVHREKDSLLAVTHCSDLMFWAEFRFQFERSPKAVWHCTWIGAFTGFKGE